MWVFHGKENSSLRARRYRLALLAVAFGGSVLSGCASVDSGRRSLAEAEAEWQQGRFQEAVKIWTDLSAHPNDEIKAEARFGLSRFHMKHENFEAAFSHAVRAFRSALDPGPAWKRHLGDTAYKLAEDKATLDPESLVELTTIAVDHDSKYRIKAKALRADARLRLGEQALDEGDPSRALAFLELAMADDPDTDAVLLGVSRAHGALGLESYRSGAYETAADHLDTALSIHAGNRTARDLRADVRFALGEEAESRLLVEEALELYVSALEDRPDHEASAEAAIRLSTSLGLDYQRAGEYSSAIRAFEDTLRIEPGHLEAVLGIARCRYALWENADPSRRMSFLPGLYEVLDALLEIEHYGPELFRTRWALAHAEFDAGHFEAVRDHVRASRDHYHPDDEEREALRRLRARAALASADRRILDGKDDEETEELLQEAEHLDESLAAEVGLVRAESRFDRFDFEGAIESARRAYRKARDEETKHRASYALARYLSVTRQTEEALLYLAELCPVGQECEVTRNRAKEEDDFYNLVFDPRFQVWLGENPGDEVDDSESAPPVFVSASPSISTVAWEVLECFVKLGINVIPQLALVKLAVDEAMKAFKEQKITLREVLKRFAKVSLMKLINAAAFVVNVHDFAVCVEEQAPYFSDAEQPAS